MGGGKTEIQQAPTTPAPSASQSATDLYQAQLQYNPQLYQQYMQMYGQYAPQVAGVDLGVQQQYAPQLQALQQQMYPQQSRLIEALSGQALGMLGGQNFQTPEQQAAVEAIRARETNRLTQAMRERANLGGNLYGGRAQDLESRALQQMGQGFAQEDINRLLQNQQMALQYATPALQIAYPQVSQPQLPNYWQGVTPSADTLYNAMYQASQPQYYAQQQSPSPLWGLGGSLLGSIGGMGYGPFGWKSP